MSMRMMVYDHFGNPLTELDVAVETTWAADAIGEAVFTIGTRDAKCREEFLEFGNLIKIDFDKLPPWVGVIARRRWSNGSVEVKCDAAEALLTYQQTKIQKVSGSAGAIFRELLNIHNEQASISITAGSVYEDGHSREETLGDSVYVHARRIQERSGQAFRIRGETADDGRLALYGDWLSTLDDIGDVAAAWTEGKHLALIEPIMEENTPIWNRVFGLGDASTNNTRAECMVEDIESQARYGLRSTNVVFSGNTALETLRRNAEEYLARWSRPTTVINCVVVDEGDNFSLARVGRCYLLELYSAGFFGGALGARRVARALAMRYNGSALEMAMEVGNVNV